jgi:hypothetical protein
LTPTPGGRTRMKRLPEPKPLADLVDSLTRRINEERCDTALLGPVVLDEDDRPYFTALTGRIDGTAHIDGLFAPSRNGAETLRSEVFGAVLRFCRPIVVHDFDDELEMAKLAEVLWPEKFAPIRRAVEEERRASCI